MKNCIIIGKGIAAELLVDQLLRSINKLSFNHITLISDDKIAPPCTYHSTATVALRGTRTGISPLGDEISKAYYLARDFYLGCDGVSYVTQYHFLSDKNKLRRYKHIDEIKEGIPPFFESNDSSLVVKKEEALVIEPELLMNFLRLKNKQNVTRLDNFVKKIEKNKEHWMMTTNENQELKCDVLILATGTYHEWIREAAPELMIPPLTPVAGGYGEWDVELEGPSFVLNLDKINVVYQSQSKKFLLGATSFSGSMSSFDFDHQSKLAEMHQMFIKNFPMFRKVLPLDKMRLKVGMRAKAKQRRMMVEILGDNFWVFNGFYKNGFSLPLLGAQKIISFYEKEAQ